MEFWAIVTTGNFASSSDSLFWRVDMLSLGKFSRAIIFMTAIFMVTPSGLQAQWRRDTGVGQIGSASGQPGATITVQGGLSVWNGSTSYSTCHSGPVKLYYWSGRNWIYVGTSNAFGCGGSLNTYGIANFRFTIPRASRRNTSIALRFNYAGNNFYFGCSGRGTVAVR